MKNLVFLLLFSPLVALAGDPVFQGNPQLDAISKALSAGDADGLAKFFSDNVEISLHDKEQVLTKARATETMRSFFAANKPKNFAQVHQGTSRESNDQYCIGNLSATTGEYRVYLYLKVAGGGLLVQEIRIDKA